MAAGARNRYAETLALIIGNIAHSRGIIIGLTVLVCLNIAAAFYARTLPDVQHPDPMA